MKNRLKRLISRTFTWVGDDAYDEGVVMGVAIGGILERNRIVNLFDYNSKKKYSSAEIHELVTGYKDNGGAF